MSSTSPVTEAAGAIPPEIPARGRGPTSGSIWKDARHQLSRNPVFVVCSLVVLVVVSWALFPQLWTSLGKLECDININRTPPSWFPGKTQPGYDADLDGYVLGTTTLGCDMYSQIIWGARPSIVVAVIVTAMTALVGTTLGLLAGYYGGWVDTVISRITDIFLGLPFLLGAVIFLALLKSQSIWAVILVLVVLGWTQMTRIVRGTALSLRDQDFVEAARAMGATNGRIILRHILPNALAPIIVLCTIYVGSFIAAEATLTFLGVGLKPPEVSWGITIAQGQDFAVAGFPHLLVFPCIVLVVTVLSFILMGDALRDALDPKGR
jgi:ABC-type dipeptide/oligopeptide/nickel transport system permease subunit